MSEPQDFSIHAVQKKRGQDESAAPAMPPPRPQLSLRPQPAAPGAAAKTPAAAPEKAGPNLPFDLLRLIAALLRNWKWEILAGLVFAGLLFLVGLLKFETTYVVSTELIRREANTTIRASLLGDAFKPRQVTVQTIVELMQSPKLLDRVGSLATPPMSGLAVGSLLTIKPEKETDLIEVTVKAKGNAQGATDLINLYAREVVALTAQMQSDEAAELDKFLRDQISRIDSQLDSINKELLDFSRENDFYGDDREVEAYLKEAGDTDEQIQTAKTDLETVDFRIASVEHELAQQDPLAIKMNLAKSELDTLRTSYTDASPLVKNAKARLDAIQAEITAAGGLKTNFDNNFQFSENSLANDLYEQLVNLRGQREGLVKQMAQQTAFNQGIQEKLRGIPAKAQHHAQIIAEQQSLQSTRDLFSGRQHEAQIYEENSPGLYRQFAPATTDSVSVSNRWIKIILVAVIGLILGMVGSAGVVLGREIMDLRVISANDLRRVTEQPVIARLPDLATLTPTQLAQWRFRTWAHMIRALKIQNLTRFTLAFTSSHPGEGKSTFIHELHRAALDRRLPVVLVTNTIQNDDRSHHLPLADALANPGLVNQHILTTPEIPLVLHFDPTWHWTLENRNRWQRAARTWDELDSLAMFVELPPMDNLDAVLTAELMPLTIWVTDSGALLQRELADSLEMVEAGEVRLVAAVLNREPADLSRLAFMAKFGLPV
jgi:uncharacterized protein involved in exopolysaccharide biosynthesis